jgi:hypothetical protein
MGIWKFVNVFDSILVIPRPWRLIVSSTDINDVKDIFEENKESNIEELKWWICGILDSTKMKKVC